MTDLAKLNEVITGRQYDIARYRLSFKVLQSIYFSDYAGSAIRGAFGHSLRRVCCMTHQRECTGCPLVSTCPYKVIFEPPVPEGELLQNFSRIPVSYLIEAPIDSAGEHLPGSVFYFDLVLIGKAIDNLALIMFAMIKAFAKDIGHGKAEFFSLDLISQDGSCQCIYDSKCNEIMEHNTSIQLTQHSPSESVTLNFLTPLRIQDNGRVVPPDELTARKLLITLIRRIDLILKFHCKTNLEIPFSEVNTSLDSVTFTHQLKFKNWSRYSNRQHQKMNLGGYVGEVKLNNLPDYMLSFLQIGQYLHVGKNAVFGLGRYELLLG